MRALALTTLTLLAALGGGCSVAINLDDYKPGELENSHIDIAVLSDPESDLEGTWYAECESGAANEANFTLQLDGEAVYFEREEAPGCADATWASGMSGTLVSIDSVSAYGKNAYELTFMLESVEVTFTDAGLAESADGNTARGVVFGLPLTEYAAGESVVVFGADAVDGADVGDAFEEDTYSILVLVSADDEVQTSLPATDRDDALVGVFAKR